MASSIEKPYELFYPLPNIEIASTLRRLDFRIPNNAPKRIEHITAILNRMYQTNYSTSQIDIRLANWNVILPMMKDEIAGKSDTEIESAIKKYCASSYQNHVVSLLKSYIPSVSFCLNQACNHRPLDPPCAYRDVTILYLSKEAMKGTLFYKACPSCRTKYHYNYIALVNGKNVLYIQNDAEVIVLFSNVGYEKQLLHQLDADILFKHCGFSNFTNAFNYTCRANGFRESENMNRFHIEKTWFLWRLSNFARNFGVHFEVPSTSDFHNMLLKIQPDIKKMFSQKWGRKIHEQYCGTNCSSTIVLDGHQKATRRVCALKNLTIPCEDNSLSEIKVGCSATPAFKSKKCLAHQSESNEDNGPVLQRREYQTRKYNMMRKTNNRSTTFSLRCKTLKSLQHKRILHRTAGIIAAVYNCGFICSLFELFGSESISQVYNFLVYMMKSCEHVPQILIYDDACHLKRFVQNRANFAQETLANKKISEMQIFCDKLHYRNHIDPWCQKNTNPYKHPIANSTNTEVCEQIFSWLAQYKNIVRGFDESTFLIYICLICDLYNIDKLEKVQKKVRD